MSNWNRRNQKIRRKIHTDVDMAMRLIREGRRDGAKRMLDSARSGLQLAPWNGGEPWAKARALSASIAIIKGPCECFYCQLTAEQKQRVGDAVILKQEDLGTVYPDEESNYTGAYAEVVFGFRYNLPINHVRGYDGGMDFNIPCAVTTSGKLTIDVKGTVYGTTEDGTVRSRFPWIPNWNSSDDHIYVLLQVVEREHVFFRGFAFGNDKRRPQIAHEGTRKHFVERPGPNRTLEELDMLLKKTDSVAVDDSAPVLLLAEVMTDHH